MRWQGLSIDDIPRLKTEYGENVLPYKEQDTWFSIAVNQFKSPLIYILIFVIVASVIFKEIEDAVLVSAVVILNVVMGFIQEFSTKKLSRV